MRLKEKHVNVFGAGLNSSDSGRRLRRGVWVPQFKREKERNYAREKREKQDKKREK